MANRVTMTICGTEYTLVAEEDAAYMEKVGAMVDGEMRQLMDGAHMSRDNAAVLAAVNLADELCKAQENADNLRRQLKTYLDEASRAKNEAAELRRKLQSQQNRKGCWSSSPPPAASTPSLPPSRPARTRYIWASAPLTRGAVPKTSPMRNSLRQWRTAICEACGSF